MRNSYSECCDRCCGKCAIHSLILHQPGKTVIAILTLPSTMLALTAKALFTPLERIEQPLVLIEEGKISSVTERSAADIPSGAQHIDFGDSVLAPGLIDIHIHGGVGYDVMQNDE